MPQDPSVRRLGPTLTDSVLPTLTDWFTTTQEGSATDVADPNGVPGARVYTATTRVEWFSAEEKFTGFFQVLYAKDSSGKWHLLAGADLDTGEADASLIDTTANPNSLLLGAAAKTIDEPIKYERPTHHANGNPISWVETTILTGALPYKDPEGDPDAVNVFPLDRLPRVGFQSARR